MATKAVGGYLSLAKLATRIGCSRTSQDIEFVMAQYFPVDAHPVSEDDGVVSTGSRQRQKFSLDDLPQELGYRAFGPTSTMIAIDGSMIIEGALKIRHRRSNVLELQPFPRHKIFLNNTNTSALPSDSFTSFKVGDKIYLSDYEIVKILDVVIRLDNMVGYAPHIARRLSRLPSMALANFMSCSMFFLLLLLKNYIQFNLAIDPTSILILFAVITFLWTLSVIALPDVSFPHSHSLQP
jgi:hypothetical protein